ncbi:MAG: outer membrane beta-barrel protein [Alphaproteobacteria bacterium]
MRQPRTIKPLSLFALSAAAALVHPAVSHADEKNVPVLAAPADEKNKTPDAAYKLLQYSDYIISAEGAAGAHYNDNIYRTGRGEESDIISTLAPRLRGKSKWERHALGFDVRGELGAYASDSENNYSDFDARVFGRYDFSNAVSADLWGRYRYEHSAIGGDPDEPDTTLKEPPTYNYFELGSALNGSFSPLYHWELGLSSLFYNYHNTSRRDGVLSIYDDKDRNESSVLATLFYDVAPQSKVFISGGANLIRYDERIDSTALYDHDADGYLALAGFSHDTETAFWSLAAGYGHQDYEAPEFEDVSMLALQGEAEFSLGPETALSFELSRDIRESSSTGVSAYVQSRGKAELEHRFDVNWSASAGARYTVNNFQSNTTLSGIDRKDKVFQPELAAHYVINDKARLSLEYRYSDRSSNNAAVEYDANIVGLRLKLRP